VEHYTACGGQGASKNIQYVVPQSPQQTLLKHIFKMQKHQSGSWVLSSDGSTIQFMSLSPLLYFIGGSNETATDYELLNMDT
jgi:hypothetical protein